ncbi:MAG: hypothetical protein IJP16_10340 [Clostridia bacterium]|nr:hypothetical protein [Clostridia bacterium]
MKILEKSYYARRISPIDGHYTFGYYDLQPFNKNLHLVHKFPFFDRLQQPGDMAEIGLLDINDSVAKFEKLDETSAWNHQQGAMLQWNPASPTDEIVYNAFIDGEFHGVVMNVNTGKKRYLDRPVANISPKGDYAVSINFPRLYDFRPGYGYADIKDPYFDVNHSDEDGVFLIDMKTGKSRLVLSMQQIWDFSGKFFDRDRKMNINHITINTDGTRFLALVRNFKEEGDVRHMTAIITANLDGSDMFLLSDYGIQSHYHWKDAENVIFYSDGKELDCRWKTDSALNLNTYVLKDKTWEGELVAGGAFWYDHHMSYSPDRKLILTDTYPTTTPFETVKIYNPETDVCVHLGHFYHVPVPTTDLRCDLHPRWNQDGSMISFDSTCEGFRGVYLIDVDAIREDLFRE